MAMEAAHRIAREKLQLAKMRQQENYDKSRHDVSYNVGDRVWLYLHHLPEGPHKFVARWIGPWRIVERVGSLAYRVVNITNDALKDIVNVRRLKLYIERAPLPQEEIDPPPDDALDLTDPALLAYAPQPPIEPPLAPAPAAVLSPPPIPLPAPAAAISPPLLALAPAATSPVAAPMVAPLEPQTGAIQPALAAVTLPLAHGGCCGSCNGLCGCSI